MNKTLLTLTMLAASSLARSQSSYAQPVREAANETSQPFQGYCGISFQGSSTTGCTFITVGTGKRLIVKSASARCLGRNGDAFGPFSIGSIVNNQTGNGAAQMRAYTALSAVPGDSGYETQRVGTMLLHQYADANRTVAATVNFVAGPNSSSYFTPRCEVHVSGYFVDVP